MKKIPLLFVRITVKNEPILAIFCTRNSEEIWNKHSQVCQLYLADITALPCEVQNWHLVSSQAIFQWQHRQPSVAWSVGCCCHRLHIDICQWLNGSSFRGRMHSGVG